MLWSKMRSCHAIIFWGSWEESKDWSYLFAFLVAKTKQVGVEGLRAETNQPIHWFLGGKGLGIQQGTSVWINSPTSGFKVLQGVPRQSFLLSFFFLMQLNMYKVRNREVARLEGCMRTQPKETTCGEIKSTHKGNFWGMWVLFGTYYMFSNFYQLNLHNKSCVALVNLQWNISKEVIKI